MKPDICDNQRLDQFLDGNLSEFEEQVLTDHLEHCTTCIDELEHRAAGKQRWRDAKLHLSSSAKWQASHEVTMHRDDQLPLLVRQVLQTLTPTDHPDRMGRIGSYEVIGVVGYGAMGVVLKAADSSLDRIVALKVMNPSLASCGTARQRFAREAKAAAGVHHPNIIAIHGVSTDLELPYLVMPYIAGESLQQRLDREGPLKLQEILRIGSQVAAGLAAAHQQGLIHRDIKPSNIMLDSGVENAVITDFGLARTIDDATMTRTGAITGTPEYMSPEQARGDAVECSSDIFSLGSVLYALCTGQRPFRAQTPFGVLRKITDTTPTSIREINPDIPTWFCQLVERMHSKTPEGRPVAGELKDLLEGGLAHVYQPDKIPLPDDLVQPTDRRVGNRFSPIQIGVIAIMTISIISILVAAMLTGNTNPPADQKEANSVPAVSQSHDDDVYKTHTLKFPNPDEKGKLVIDINRGSIDVTGYEGSEVIIQVLNPYAKKDKSKANDESVNVIFAPRYDLDSRAKENVIKLDTYNQDYVLNLRIKVPYETNLKVDSYRSGYIKVEKVSGVIDSHSEHNDITMHDIAGSATAFTRNGIMDIRFNEVAEDAKLDFETYNGALNLTLPAEIKATTAISTGTGTYRSAFNMKSLDDNSKIVAEYAPVQRNLTEYQFSQINGGGIPIRLESRNGEIQILKSQP